MVVVAVVVVVVVVVISALVLSAISDSVVDGAVALPPVILDGGLSSTFNSALSSTWMNGVSISSPDTRSIEASEKRKSSILFSWMISSSVPSIISNGA